MNDATPYQLLTPGPLNTSPTVRAAMGRDWCTWESEYLDCVQDIRRDLLRLAAAGSDCECVPIQGTGTYAVEAAFTTEIPDTGKVLIVDNGAYGDRMVRIARCQRLPHAVIHQSECEPIDPALVEQALRADPEITHVAVVHCETTTGLLNPVEDVGAVVKRFGKTFLVDAVSSFGGIPLTMDGLHADYLVSTANKCIQGVPGFGFVLARRGHLEQTAGRARSLSLDLYDQWREMEEKRGKFRFTSPTHAVRAFAQALQELKDEGGVEARHRRYRANQERVRTDLETLGFEALIPRSCQSPILTAFHYPDDPNWSFPAFYASLKRRGYRMFPGPVSKAPAFRIANMGHVFLDDIVRLTGQVAEVVQELGLRLSGRRS